MPPYIIKYPPRSRREPPQIYRFTNLLLQKLQRKVAGFQTGFHFPASNTPAPSFRPYEFMEQKNGIFLPSNRIIFRKKL